MSLAGPWPAQGGLPVLTGEAKAKKDAELVSLIDSKLKVGPSAPAPIDLRLEQFLAEHLKGVRDTPLKLPPAIHLTQYGLAKVLSLPRDGDYFQSDLLKSYRCHNGVLHNPVNDKRTTIGVFHVAEGSFPISHDKKAVPLSVFSKLLDHAINDAPAANLELPYTSNEANKKQAWVSSMLRPLVCPEVPGYCSEKRFEVRFYAPGSMVANIDFVENVFGNAGDPALPENDAALDPEHWSGQTGCVMLAPHLLQYTKKELGLPHWEEATERQRKDSMAWKDESEKYNDGGAFKICVRSPSGFFITLLADNYFGYCKKEVKTQMSFSCNLFGSEEEHAGGALAWPTMSWGHEFKEDNRVLRPNHHFDSASGTNEKYHFVEAMKLLGDKVAMQPEGYAIDAEFPTVMYVPEDAVANIDTGKVSWGDQAIWLVPGAIYVHPSGYQFTLEKQLSGLGWHITGTCAEPINCHKPSTVSGGGKSEISKLFSDMVTFGNVRVDDVKKDLAFVDLIMKRDYSDQFSDESLSKKKNAPILDPSRTLGSVVKLLTPSMEYTNEYNEFLLSIPPRIRSMVFLVKHNYKPSWGTSWQQHVGVEKIDGHEGDVVYIEGDRVVSQYVRIGRDTTKRDRKFMLRHDFVPARKIQTEDDISASIVAPRSALGNLNPEQTNPCVKLVKNCELRLFQRPDDALIRGYDTQCELDMSAVGNFMSNFEPVTKGECVDMVKQAVAFDKFTQPMQERLSHTANSEGGPTYVVSSANFRIVNGKPTANPRYLQVRTDFEDKRKNHLAEISAKLRRRIPADLPVHFPVSAVLPGRRNNPPDALADGTPIRPLSVFNPLHFQELPELFAEFICSLTGKSPSTTGAGSEGALTKGPFNALRFAADLNTTLVGWILTGYAGFSSAAGYIGGLKVDHDISLLVPEIWCRMSETERSPAWLIEHGCLEKVDDFEVNGQDVLGSRLGYRISQKFVHQFLGRIFESPSEVFDTALLKPETQDWSMFVDGINNIVEAHAKTAKGYIADGTVDDLCPPLQAVVKCMAEQIKFTPEMRALFSREAMLASDWYKQRLAAKQKQEIGHWNRSILALEALIAAEPEKAKGIGADARLAAAQKSLGHASSAAFLGSLVGTVGCDPSVQDSQAGQPHLRSAL